MKTRRAIRESIGAGPLERDVLRTIDLPGGYRQTQAGENAPELTAEQVAELLAFPDDRPPAERIHRVDLTSEELEELENPDPELES